MNKLKVLLIIFLFSPLFSQAKIYFSSISENKTEAATFTDSWGNSIYSEKERDQNKKEFASSQWKSRFVSFIKKNIGEDNKAIAAILAFPLFGIVGLHRIYLGTKPYVPVVYIATLGGCAGVLPAIDFFAILFANKETFARYKENPNVFMWVK